LCDDNPAPFGYADPDPYVKITLGNGQSFRSKTTDNVCDKTIVLNMNISNVDPSALRNTKIEVLDEDPANNDDHCFSWQGDLSTPGRRTITISSAKNASITIDIKK
jgi:hypothetical protein